MGDRGYFATTDQKIPSMNDDARMGAPAKTWITTNVGSVLTIFIALPEC
jgi:hypothetical protein